MKETNNPFNIVRTTTSLSINKGGVGLLDYENHIHSPRVSVFLCYKMVVFDWKHPKSMLILRLITSHYNDYKYNAEDDIFENSEDGHNIIEAFTRDLMHDYQGCPTY